MLGFFVANNQMSSDFNVYLSDAGVYGVAERDVEAVSIPGKSGDLIMDNGRYKNCKISYPCIIIDNFDTNFSALINFLVTQEGYFRLEDSFHPEYFMYARYAGGTEPKSVVNEGTWGKFILEFDRKPQKYLVEGEDVITITANTAILSNSNQVAKPLIRAYGTGSFSIGGVSVQITSANSYTDIDCDLQECYKDTLATNCNGNVILTNGKFPELVLGANSITLSGITRLDITPRWWKL